MEPKIPLNPSIDPNERVNFIPPKPEPPTAPKNDIDPNEWESLNFGEAGTGTISDEDGTRFYTKGNLYRRTFRADGRWEEYDENRKITATGTSGTSTPEPTAETVKTPEQIDLENRTRRIFSEKIRLLEEAEKAFGEGDLERADELCGESLRPLGIIILKFLGPENEKNVPPDIMDLQRKYSELSYSLEHKLSHIQPAPKPASEQETDRERTLAALRATIANTQKILDEEAEIRATIMRRLAEIREAKNTATKKKERVELPEDVKNFIDEELKRRERSLESFTEKNDTDMIDFVKTKIELLQSDPIKYWTVKKEEALETLDFVSKNTTWTEERRQDAKTGWSKKVANFQKIIDVLEANLGK